VTVGFDAAGRVGWISGWRQVRIEPPWRTWWKKWFGQGTGPAATRLSATNSN
jgi:hypothetical protein